MFYGAMTHGLHGSVAAYLRQISGELLFERDAGRGRVFADSRKILEIRTFISDPIKLTAVGRCSVES